MPEGRVCVRNAPRLHEHRLEILLGRLLGMEPGWPPQVAADRQLHDLRSSLATARATPLTRPAAPRVIRGRIGLEEGEARAAEPLGTLRTRRRLPERRPNRSCRDHHLRHRACRRRERRYAATRVHLEARDRSPPRRHHDRAPASAQPSDRSRCPGAHRLGPGYRDDSTMRDGCIPARIAFTDSAENGIRAFGTCRHARKIASANTIAQPHVAARIGSPPG